MEAQITSTWRGRPTRFAGADRLTSAVRGGDRVIRYGGDEFVVLCHDVPTTPTITRVAEHIIELVEQPIEVKGSLVAVSASVGVSIVDGAINTMDQVLST